jgi:hypothetical protein
MAALSSTSRTAGRERLQQSEVERVDLPVPEPHDRHSGSLFNV